MIQSIRKVLVIAILALALAFGGCVKYPAVPINMAKLTVFERMVNSVVVLPGCTGIVLKNEGKSAVILTAAHCVRRFQTKLPDGKEIYLPVPVGTELNKEAACVGFVGNVSLSRDLAIITIEKCQLPTAVAVLAQAPPKLGEVVYAVGHPAAANYVLTKGIVSRPTIMLDATKYMLLSAPVIFGNSGGPCLNKHGEVVGVVTDVGAIRVRTEDGRPFPLYVGVTHLGLAVPLDEVKQFLKVSGFASLAR
jgi:S1-C subfamily serine protease